MRLLRALLFAALWLLPSLAEAQIKPSGSSFTPGHTTRVMNPQGTVLGDAGGSAGSSLPGQSYLTELGITNTGTPLCINDALTNAAGGYHAFCVGANALGGGLISYNAFGGRRRCRWCSTSTASSSRYRRHRSASPQSSTTRR